MNDLTLGGAAGTVAADVDYLRHQKEQESCAIAKMTAQCALHMGALKIFGTA